MNDHHQSTSLHEDDVSLRCPDATSHSLLERARSHDEGAWRCLTDLYGPLIYHWCRKAALGAEDSADVLQDVFASVLLHISAFEKTETSGSFRAWLWTITRNKIRDHYKVRSGKPNAVGGTEAHLQLLAIPDHELGENADSAVSATNGLTYRALHIIRGEVKETTWLAFWRSTIDEVAPAAVAEELEISVASVWQAKSRVLRRLRELLE